MKKALLYILLPLFPLTVFGQDVKITAAFDSARIFMGDQIHFTVTLEKPGSMPLVFPVLKDTLQKNIEILRGPVTDSTDLKNGRVRIVNKYLVTSFDSGFYQVLPQYAEERNSGGIKRYFSDYARLEVMRVRTSPADTTMKFYDIVKPYRAPVTAGEILPWLLLAAVIASAAWYGWKLYKKLKKKGSADTEPEVNPDPAHVIALGKLEKLKEEQLWQKGEVKLYYTRLSEIVREYLENRYGIQSLELTTYETLALLKKTGFREDELYRKLKTLLTGADLVKFAKYKPEASEYELNYEQAWDFVSLTRIVEAPSEDGASGSGKGGGA